ncbi:MAG: T9SS C-terminal target domain-containing protein, partial [Sphingobacteriales bacterium]
QAGFRFGANPTSNKLYFKANGQTYESDALTAGTFTDNTCRHVAVVREGTVIKFYINGVLSGTRTINGTMNITNGNFYLIGTDTEETTDVMGNKLPINNFVGVIREARLWKEPKTQTFIVDNMRKKISVANQNGGNLASYLRLNDGAGTTPADLAYLGNPAAIPVLNGIGLYYQYLPGQTPTSGTTANWSFATCNEMIFRKGNEETALISNAEQNGNVLIYPNPTKNDITVKLSSEFLTSTTTLSIYGLNGTVLYTASLTSLENQLDIKSILKTKGIYFVKIANGTDSKHFKVALND